jgi:hypothetical protein
MPTDRSTLEAMDREALIARAQADGVPQAKVLTRPELIDEILRREPGRTTDDVRRARGFLGLARDLLARVVERGLHLADAADRIRSGAPVSRPPPPSALPTVTLAEIYATQGHKNKAIDTLKQVLSTEPEHAAAAALLEKLEEGKIAVPDAPILPPESDEPIGSSFMETSSSAPDQEPATMLDSEPLPDKYDVDECIAINVDPTTLYVYWEIKDDTFANLRQRMPSGKISLRVLVMVPSWEGPRASFVDLEVHSAIGDWFVRELPEGAVLRASVGWKSSDGLFVSAAHSRGVEPSRRDRAPAVAQWLARWTPEKTISLGASEPEAQKLARALARIEARRIARLKEQGIDEWGQDAAETAGELGRRALGSSDRFVAGMPSSWS